MPKITQYPAKTVPSNNDEFVFHEPASGSTKKMTRGDLIGGAPLPANSVTTAAIANGSVTPAKMNNPTSVVSGWTVYDYGKFKHYVRQWFIPNAGTLPASVATLVVSSFSLPSGKSPSNSYISVDGTSGAGSTALVPTIRYVGTSTSTTDTYNVYMRNLTASPVAADNVTITVTVRDR